MAKKKKEPEGQIFELSPEQMKKFEKWKKKLPKIPDNYTGAAGGNYGFTFIPTGLGTLVGAYRADDPEKHKIDLTEWEYF